MTYLRQGRGKEKRKKHQTIAGGGGTSHGLIPCSIDKSASAEVQRKSSAEDGQRNHHLVVYCPCSGVGVKPDQDRVRRRKGTSLRSPTRTGIATSLFQYPLVRSNQRTAATIHREIGSAKLSNWLGGGRKEETVMLDFGAQRNGNEQR